MSEEKAILQVEGMSCGHCVNRVEKVLSNLSGVCEVKVDLDSGEAGVTYKSNKVNLVQLKQAIKDAGYEVK